MALIGDRPVLSLVDDMIEFAVQVANDHLVPEGMAPGLWGRLSPSERFYLKMLDVEEAGAKKLDNYQNFAKALRVSDYVVMMGSLAPNAAKLKTATDLRKLEFAGSEFGASPLRAGLYALYEIGRDVEGADVMSHLRDLVAGYHDRREDLMSMADYVAKKWARLDEDEARAARILVSLIRNERLG